MLYHKDVENKIVDLTKSVVNEEKSKIDPKKHQYDYHFDDKVYYRKYKDLKKSPWHFAWCNQDDQFIKKWRYQMGYDFVYPDKDPYFPELAYVNENGYWEFGDTVLMKCSIEKYVERQVERAIQNKRRTEGSRRKLRQIAVDTGMNIADLDKMEKSKREKVIDGLRNTVMDNLGFE